MASTICFVFLCSNLATAGSGRLKSTARLKGLFFYCKLSELIVSVLALVQFDEQV